MNEYGLLTAFGGLGLLLFGIRTTSESLQVLAGDRLRQLVGRVVESRWRGIATGVVASLIIQSSAVTTVMVVSYVNAGLMPLWQAASVILGANVGATITGWLLALRLSAPALVLLGGGAWLALFAERDAVKFSGELALGIGLLFAGLSLVETGFAPLRSGSVVAHWLAGLGAGSRAQLVFTALLGMALTMLVRSASAMVGVTMALGTVGLIDFGAAAALVLGENVGTTINAQLAARSATADSRRAALFHSLVNALGALVLLVGFRQWIGTVDALVPGDPDLFGSGGVRPWMGVHVALAHTSFNLIMVALAVPVLTPLVRLVEHLVGPGPRERIGLKFLRASLVESPALAIEQCRLEVLHMAEVADEALRLTRRLYDEVTSPGTDLRDAVIKLEKTTDSMQHQITVFMSRVMAGVLTVAQGAESRGLVRVADEIESVADYCERLANYRRRLVREQIPFADEALHDLQRHFERTIALYEDILDRARRNDTGWLKGVRTKGQYLATEANTLRDANLQRLATQRSAPAAGIFFNDMLVAMRRIRNHSINVAEAWLREDAR